MNNKLFADELAAIFAADPAVAVRFMSGENGPHIYPIQSGAVADRPSLVVNGEYQPYGTRRKGFMELELRNRINLEDETTPHQAAFKAVYTKLFGNPKEGIPENIAREALKSAFLARGNVELIQYGWRADGDAITADAEDADLRTILRLNVAWRFL